MRGVSIIEDEVASGSSPSSSDEMSFNEDNRCRLRGMLWTSGSSMSSLAPRDTAGSDESGVLDGRWEKTKLRAESWVEGVEGVVGCP